MERMTYLIPTLFSVCLLIPVLPRQYFLDSLFPSDGSHHCYLSSVSCRSFSGVLNVYLYPYSLLCQFLNVQKIKLVHSYSIMVNHLTPFQLPLSKLNFLVLNAIHSDSEYFPILPRELIRQFETTSFSVWSICCIFVATSWIVF